MQKIKKNTAINTITTLILDSFLDTITTGIILDSIILDSIFHTVQ